LRFRSTGDNLESLEKTDDERVPGDGKRNKGGIFRSISIGATGSTNEAPEADESNPEHKEHEKEPLPEPRSEDEDEESFEEEVSVHSSQLSELDLDEDLDWESLPPLPLSFLGDGTFHSSMSQYLDEWLQRRPMPRKEANHFATEHSLLIRAILQLLEEKQIRGIAQIDADDIVILKQGSLKKFSHSVGRPIWKVKYAEVRRGSFSYYEDSGNDSKNARKTILLGNCICQEAENKVGNFVFELLPENSPRRLFMCSSEEERQAWMRIIEEAQQEKKNPINLGPYQWSIDTYKDMQTNLRFSISKSEYMLYLGDISRLKLQLPIQWVLEQAEEGGDDKRRAPKTRTIDFWKFLLKQAVVVNGHSIPVESPHAPERIIGALSRCILEYDHSWQEEHAHHNLTEVQAVSYARDILMAVWQSRARDDSHYALDCMCRNSDLVIVLPMSEDPLIHVSVGYSTSEDLLDPSPEFDGMQQMSGWVTTRSKSPKNWKNRFCVVSEGVLSYYEHAYPRPHGLRGQLVLVGATINEVHEKAREDMHLHILHIATKDQERERQLSFRDEDDFVKWREAIQHAIDSCTSPEQYLTEADSLERRRNRKLAIPNGSRFMKKGMEGGSRMMKNAAEGGFKVISKGATDLFEKITRQKTDEKRRPFGTLLEQSPTGDQPRFEPPSVQVKVESCRHYRVITSDPSGDDQEDTWLTVRASTCQLFKLSGGPNGRFALGEEIVELDFFHGLVDEEGTKHRKRLSIG
jgi:hypothetical protein